MPPITQVLAVTLAGSRACKPEFLVCPRLHHLRVTNLTYFLTGRTVLGGVRNGEMSEVCFEGVNKLTASGMLSFPANFRHTASTAALSVA